MNTFQPAAALAVLILLGSASAAGADTFCVSAPGCSGTSQPTVGDALAASTANGGGRDTIRIGPGVFDEPDASDATGNSVDIVGAGAGLTTLISSTGTSNTSILSVLEATSTVTDVGFRLSGSGAGTGLTSVGTAERVRVFQTGGNLNASGVTLRQSAVLRSSTVDLAQGTSSGVVVQQDADATIEDVRADAQTALLAGGPATIRRVRLRGNLGVNVSTKVSANVTVEDALIETIAGVNPPTAIETISFANASAAATVDVSHVTAVGNGAPSDVGVESRALAGSATVTVRNSTLSGFDTDLKRTTNAGGDADLSADFSNYDPGRVSETGAGTGTLTQGPANVLGTPAFVDPAQRDYRPRAGSPLVDRADPASPGAGESTTDLAGGPRRIDGDGDAAARADIGAFEYARQAPSVTAATAAPGVTGPGQPIHFSASATDADGDALAFRWSFDDGTSADGAEVDHAFAAAGPHTATVTVTDSGGKTATAAVPVQIDAPAGPPGAGPGAGAGPSGPVGPADTLAPVMGFTSRTVRASRSGNVDVTLRCPAAEQSGPCAGTLVLQTAKKVRATRRGRSKVIALGRGTFSIAAGKTGRARIRLSKPNRALLTRLGKVQANAAAGARDGAGNSGTTRATLTLKAPR